MRYLLIVTTGLALALALYAPTVDRVLTTAEASLRCVAERRVDCERPDWRMP